MAGDNGTPPPSRPVQRARARRGAGSARRGPRWTAPGTQRGGAGSGVQPGGEQAARTELPGLRSARESAHRRGSRGGSWGRASGGSLARVYPEVHGLAHDVSAPRALFAAGRLPTRLPECRSGTTAGPPIGLAEASAHTRSAAFDRPLRSGRPLTPNGVLGPDAVVPCERRRRSPRSCGPESDRKTSSFIFDQVPTMAHADPCSAAMLCLDVHRNRSRGRPLRQRPRPSAHRRR